MTHESIENLISKILNSPDHLSDSEIADIIHDDYLRELYDAASLLKSASEPLPPYNLDHEWQDLMNRLNGMSPSKVYVRKRKWLRLVAVFIGVIVCGAITIMLFRSSDTESFADMAVKSMIDSVPAGSAISSSIASSVENLSAEGSLSSMRSYDSIIPPVVKPKTANPSQSADSETSDNPMPNHLPSIAQALLLTDGDVIAAQMFLSPIYESSAHESESFVTTVNYGERVYEEVSQSTWLTEFMKYATGLTDLNLQVRRGSANMLFRLTCSASGVSDSDRGAAASIISSLLADEVCADDPLTLVLVLGSIDNLK